MVISFFKYTIQVNRGYPKARSRGPFFETLEDANYARGYDHGVNKERAKFCVAVVRLEREADLWKCKYKAEVPQLAKTIERLKKHVPAEVLAHVFEGRELPTPNDDAPTRGGASGSEATATPKISKVSEQEKDSGKEA